MVHVTALLRVISLAFLADNYLIKMKPEWYISPVTVPPPSTDQSLRHSTTRVGLWARRVRIFFFRENVRFGRFSWAIAHGFRHLGQFFANLPDCHKILEDDILWGFQWFLDHRVHIPGLLLVISLPFLADNYLLKWKPEWHISPLTVPPPSTDHSLRHSTTRVGLCADGFEFHFFAKMSISGDFREL
jgi:hypothetical protein